MTKGRDALDMLLTENRTFSSVFGIPSPCSRVSDAEVYDRAAADPEAFWEEWARELDWFEPWHTVLDWQPPHAKWFLGGKLNVAHNCLDRHLERTQAESGRPHLGG